MSGGGNGKKLFAEGENFLRDFAEGEKIWGLPVWRGVGGVSGSGGGEDLPGW